MTRTRTKVALAVALLALIAIVATVAVRATGVLQSQIIIKVNNQGTSTSTLGIADDLLTKDYTQLFSSGLVANQASDQFYDQRTIAASSSENLDLYGSLTNSFGTTLNFTRLRAIIIHAASTNTNNVQVGGAASNQFINWVADPTDIVSVRPNGTLVLIAPDSTGYAITANTGDILKIANSSSGSSVTYDIILIGPTP